MPEGSLIKDGRLFLGLYVIFGLALGIMVMMVDQSSNEPDGIGVHDITYIARDIMLAIPLLSLFVAWHISRNHAGIGGPLLASFVVVTLGHLLVMVLYGVIEDSLINGSGRYDGPFGYVELYYPLIFPTMVIGALVPILAHFNDRPRPGRYILGEVGEHVVDGNTHEE